MNDKPDGRGAMIPPAVRRHGGGSNLRKRSDDWTTREPMTEAQRSYLQTLSDAAGERFDDSLSKADASRRIDELQQRTGCGILH
jgi:Protein of unknown function (DUF3072)